MALRSRSIRTRFYSLIDEHMDFEQLAVFSLVLVLGSMMFQLTSFVLALFFGLVLLTRHRPTPSQACAVRLLGACLLALGASALVAIGNPREGFSMDLFTVLMFGPFFALTGNSPRLSSLLPLLALAPGVMLIGEVLLARRSRALRRSFDEGSQAAPPSGQR